MEERDNVLRILIEAKKALKEGDALKLKEISNQTIHTASISQDPDNIAVAVTVYALGKIIERKNYRNYRAWPKFFKISALCLERAISAIEKNQEGYFQDQLKCIRREVNLLSGNLKRHIQEVFKKAEISKASRVYEHGISMEQTAKLLGITIWELAEYTGQTGIADVNIGITLSEKERIKYAMNIFEK